MGETSDTQKRSVFDRFVLLLAVFESLSTLPQLYEIWIKKETAGVSVLTWAGYFAIEYIWLVYAVRQRDKALIGGSLSWGIMEALVAIGALVR